MRNTIIKKSLIVALGLCTIVPLAGCSTGSQNVSSLSILNVETADLPVDDIFSAEKVEDNIVRIHGMAGELMYLVEGDEKAVLIDTGSGAGDLKGYVEQMTDKPLTVLLTHGHVDHASGAAAFDNVYINHLDDAVYAEHNQLAVRQGFIESQNPEGYAALEDSDYVPQRDVLDYQALNDGDEFDLGGTTLVAYDAAGHTPGTMAILFKEQRILMTGDAANMSTFLFDQYTLGIKSYKESMEDLDAKTGGQYDKVFLSHGSGDAPVELMGNITQLCTDIQNGNVDDVPFEFMGMQAYIAKEINAQFERVDGLVGNIIYSKEKVDQ